MKNIGCPSAKVRPNLVPSSNERRRVIQAIAASVGSAVLGSCSSEGPETPVDKLIDHFLQNFNPYEYGKLAENAYAVSEKRYPDAALICSNQELAEMSCEQLVDFLIDCKSRKSILDFFDNKRLNQSWSADDKPESVAERSKGEEGLRSARSLKVDNPVIEDGSADSDLYRIFALIGRDPELYVAFLRACLTYRGWDLGKDDIFRDPVSVLRSGWADCDDWTTLHYFWAYIHKYEPNLVVAVTPDTVSTGAHSASQNAHTLTWYVDEVRNKMVVLDNGSCTLLGIGSDIGDYLRDKYPAYELKVEFNGPYNA